VFIFGTVDLLCQYRVRTRGRLHVNDWLERLIPEMTYYVSSVTLLYTHSLTQCPRPSSFHGSLF